MERTTAFKETRPVEDKRNGRTQISGGLWHHRKLCVDNPRVGHPSSPSRVRFAARKTRRAPLTAPGGWREPPVINAKFQIAHFPTYGGTRILKNWGLTRDVLIEATGASRSDPVVHGRGPEARQTLRLCVCRAYGALQRRTIIPPASMWSSRRGTPGGPVATPPLSEPDKRISQHPALQHRFKPTRRNGSRSRRI